MNNEDLVKRGDVKAFRRVLFMAGKLVSFVTIKDINCVPAVPREMTAREFVKAHHRMCQSGISCDECGITHDGEVPRSCVVLMGLNPDDTVAIVEKWAQEHPEEANDER